MDLEEAIVDVSQQEGTVCSQGASTGMMAERLMLGAFNLSLSSLKGVPESLLSTPAARDVDPSKGSHRCKAGHLLVALGTTRDNGWSCSGADEPAGCNSGIVDFGKTTGMARFRCEQCDYDLCAKCLQDRPRHDRQLEIGVLSHPVEGCGMTGGLFGAQLCNACVPLLTALAPLLPSGRAIFAQLPPRWLNFSGRSDAMGTRCLFASRRHERSVFEHLSPSELLRIPCVAREWQPCMDVPVDALQCTLCNDKEPWIIEAHPSQEMVRVVIQPGLLLHRMLRRSVALPAARFTWRVIDSSESTTSTTAASTTAAPLGEFSILSNLEDAAHIQPVGFQEFPLRPEQLRSLGWMVAQERRRLEPFVTELRESASCVDAPHWSLEGKVWCEYSGVKGGVLADAIGYGKTACTIGLIDCTHTDPVPTVPRPYAGFIPTCATLVLAPTNLHAQWIAEIMKFTGRKLKVLSIPTCAQLKKLTPREIMEADVVVATYRIFYSQPYLQRLEEIVREQRPAFAFPKSFNASGGGRQKVARVPVNAEWARAYRDVFEVLPSWAETLRENGDAPVTPTRSRVGAKLDDITPEEVAAPHALQVDPNGEALQQPQPSKRRRLLGKRAAAEFSNAAPQPGAAADVSASLPAWCETAKYVPLEAFWWKRVVCDEFHELLSRYPPAQAAVELFHADYKWGLSGTPPCQTLAQIRKAAGFLGVQIPSGTCDDLDHPRKVAQTWLDAFARRNTAELPPLEEEEHIVAVRQSAKERALYLALTDEEARAAADEPVELRNARQSASGLLKLCSHFARSGAADMLSADGECERVLVQRKEQARVLERDLRSTAERAASISRQIRHFEPHFCRRPKDSSAHLFLAKEPKARLAARLKFLSASAMGKKPELLARLFEALGSPEISEATKDVALRVRFDSKTAGLAVAALKAAGKAPLAVISSQPPPAQATFASSSSTSCIWASIECLAFLVDGSESPTTEDGREVLTRVIRDVLALQSDGAASSRCARLRSSLCMPRWPGNASAETEPELLQEQWDWLSDEANACKLREALQLWKAELETLSQRILALEVDGKAKLQSVCFFEQTLRAQSSGAFECPICLKVDEPIIKRAILPCGHVGCLNCLAVHVDRASCCPICSSVCQAADVMRIDCGDAPIPCAAAEDEGVLSIFAKYGSKIEAIVKTVARVQGQDPSCKIICFVQWEDLKRKISSALEEFEIDHVTLHGSVWARRAALMKFQYEGEGPRMLLLSLEESASGTNLTAANHVIIVHPMEAATREEAVAFEMQAIGRVRRPGQQKKIHVWRFVTMGTIEQTLTEEHQRELWERQGAGVALTQEWADTMETVAADNALPTASATQAKIVLDVEDNISSEDEAEPDSVEVSPTQPAAPCESTAPALFGMLDNSDSQHDATTQSYPLNSSAIATPVHGVVGQFCGISEMDCETQVYQITPPDNMDTSCQPAMDRSILDPPSELPAEIFLGAAVSVASPVLDSLEDVPMTLGSIEEEVSKLGKNMDDMDAESLIASGASDSIVWA